MTQKQENITNKNTRKPEPCVLSINVCDNVIRDEATKKVSLIGLFNTIKANSFPCKHPLMHVYVALTNGHGKCKTEIRFLSLKDNKPIAWMEGELDFQNPLQVAELNMCWQNLTFEKEGEYEVEVRCDGTRIQARKFMVIGPQQNLSSTSGTEAE